MPECFSVKDRVIVITGALGFLGSTYAEGFSQDGANVVVVDLDGARCRQRAEEVAEKYGTRPLGLDCDITSRAEVEEMVRQVVAEYGCVDVLVNNAATKTENFFAPFEEYPLEDWDEVMRVDVTGMFLCSQAVAREMEKKRSGSIVNISSIYGVVAPDQRIYQGAVYQGKQINTPPVYSTSKGAVISFTRHLAAYLAG